MRPRRPKLLSSSRPPHRISKPARAPTLSAKKGRSLIRSFHTLRKQHAAALAAGDTANATRLQAEMDAQGGLAAYQTASLNGQGRERGGDSSEVLVGWLGAGGTEGGGSAMQRARKRNRNVSGQDAAAEKEARVRVLEVGCLSPLNAVSKMHGARVDRLDLHSQHPVIEEQDFMERPVPRGESERYDVVSLSLVLNYVEDAMGKGEMLRRTTEFMKAPEHEEYDNEGDKIGDALYPCLFLVLPAPCVQNSRYLDEEHLARIMQSLGYRLKRQKVSSKLIYMLWRWAGPGGMRKQAFRREEIRPGGARNNFSIVLK